MKSFRVEYYMDGKWVNLKTPNHNYFNLLKLAEKWIDTILKEGICWSAHGLDKRNYRIITEFILDK